MDLAAYLGTVAALVTLAVASMSLVAAQLGRRIDDVRADVGTLRGEFAGRFDRVDTELSAVRGAVVDVAERVGRIERG